MSNVSCIRSTMASWCPVALVQNIVCGGSHPVKNVFKKNGVILKYGNKVL